MRCLLFLLLFPLALSAQVQQQPVAWYHAQLSTYWQKAGAASKAMSSKVFPLVEEHLAGSTPDYVEVLLFRYEDGTNTVSTHFLYYYPEWVMYFGVEEKQGQAVDVQSIARLSRKDASQRLRPFWRALTEADSDDPAAELTIWLLTPAAPIDTRRHLVSDSLASFSSILFPE